jgi:hypothetical protein
MKEKIMSSTAYAAPLHAVPDTPLTTKERFGALVHLRMLADRARNLALSVPRSAIGWAVNTFDRLVEATAGVGTFLRDQAGNAASLIRATGVVPIAVAVLSTPPVAAAVTGAARFVGNGLRRVASAAWSGLKGLLGRCGSTGEQISQSLSNIGTQVANSAMRLAAHPVMVPVVRVLRATAAMVRPVSQGFVAHRLLGALVPVVWLRAILELLVMPLLLVDTTVSHKVRTFVNTRSVEASSNGTRDTQDSAAEVLSFGPVQGPVPKDSLSATNRSFPCDGGVHAEQAVDDYQADDEDPPLNRASRRAQLRQEARATRNQQHRR